MSQRVARIALITIAAGILLTAALLYTAAQPRSTSRAPGDTVRAAFRAYRDGDLPALGEHFCDPNLAELVFPISGAPRYRFTDMTYTERETSATAAQVIASGTLQDTTAGDTRARPLRWTVELARGDDAWCITAVTRTP